MWPEMLSLPRRTFERAVGVSFCLDAWRPALNQGFGLGPIFVAGHGHALHDMPGLAGSLRRLCSCVQCVEVLYAHECAQHICQLRARTDPKVNSGFVFSDCCEGRHVLGLLDEISGYHFIEVAVRSTRRAVV